MNRSAKTVALFLMVALLGACLWLARGMYADLQRIRQASDVADPVATPAAFGTATRGGGEPASQRPAAELRFRIRLSAEAEQGIRDLGLEVPVHGRAYVVVSRSSDREPRLQTDLTGVPFWGKDVDGLGAGGSVVIADGDVNVIGYPLERIADLPAGSYYVQAFLNVYTTFDRSDGHTVRMHLNSGAGQHPWRAPGNAHSDVALLDLDPASTPEVDLQVDRVIPPVEPLEGDEVLQQGNPDDSERVKFVKIRSQALSEFWGHDMYIGANVLLPAGYDDNPTALYPTLYMQGHFPGRSAPLGYREPGTESGRGRGRSEAFSRFWLSDAAPQMVAVTIRDANPYYDTSYAVNSANVGPYGDAIHEELIPYLESEFRLLSEPWARVLAGGSTGGWEAIALQVFYPEFYGGAWGWCPDPVDFNYYQIVNVYEEDNAYWTDYGWIRVERPNARRPDGNVRSTVRMENLYERAVGPNSRSAGQWAIWEAVFGPVGPDGYPAPIWDQVTGVIDRDVARYWLDNYDIHNYLRRNWSQVGPDLAGKIHIAVGDMDTYYLEQAVYLLEEFLTGVDEPPARATFEYGRRKPHCWIGASPTNPDADLSNAEFVRIAADYVRDNAPPGTDVSGWYQ